MRQAFLSTPWIHNPVAPEVMRLFNEKGRWVRLATGASIFNGGDVGEIALILSGLCAFGFNDCQGNSHIFSLILPGRLMGDVDGITGETVNVTDFALRESEARILPRQVFLNFMNENPKILLKHTRGIISDHESDMEGMIACFTLPAQKRILALFSSLIFHASSESEAPEGWLEVPYAISVTEISQITAIARPTVSSILSKWTSEGLACQDGKRRFIRLQLLEGVHDWRHYGPYPAARIRKRRTKE